MASADAVAEPVAYSFSGSIQNVVGNAQGIAQGDSISGTFFYDPTAIAASGSNAYLSSFPLASGYQITAVIDGHTVWAPEVMEVIKGAGNNPSFAIGFGTPSVDGQTFSAGQFSIGGWTVAFSNLPQTLSISLFPLSHGGMTGEIVSDKTGNPAVAIVFAINTIIPVPEPATFAMHVVGICGLGFVVWRRKTHRQPSQPDLAILTG